jgi:hypothetical protein
MGSTLQRLRFPALSIIIIGILGLQLIAGFKHTNKWFPFMWYPMYGHPNFEGDRILVNHSIFVVTPDGKRRLLDRDVDMKMGFWLYEDLAKRLGRKEYDRVADGIAMIQALQPDVTRIEVEDYPLIITRNGPKPAPRKIIVSIDRATIDKWVKR